MADAAPPDSVVDVMAWMGSSEMDRTAAYVQRGRTHSGLSDADLLDRWKAAFEAFAGDPTLAEKRVRESDLKAEIELRGQTPPWEAVKATLEELNARFIWHLERLRREDPEEFSRLEMEIMRAVDGFRAEARSSEN